MIWNQKHIEQMKQIVFVEPEIMNGSRHAPGNGVGGAGQSSPVWKGVSLLRAGTGKVKALFEHGSSAIGDVLVGADGTGSKVCKQYLPQAQIVDTGIVGAACRLPINWGDRGYLPEHLLTRFTSIVAHGAT